MAPAPDGVRRAFVHIGLRKTGTSFLQSHLWASPDLLAERGVRMVPRTREQAVVLTRAVRGRLDDAARVERAFARVARISREAPEPTLVLTQESLAGATATQAQRLLAAFDGREVHLVVTARDIARQLPSAWQQRVKANADTGFAEFLDAVRSRRGAEGRAFWEQQDLVAVLARWSQGLPPDQVHVVTVAPGSDRASLPARFGSVIGVDFAGLHGEVARPNVSIDPAQVEVLRRVNRLRPLEGRRERAETVKNFFVTQVLAPHRGRRAVTPVAMRQWCDEQARRQVDAVGSAGFHVVGDLTDLLPRAEDFGADLAEVSEAEVAEVAVQAVADLLARHHQDARELADLRARARSGPVTGDAPAAGKRPGPRFSRRRAR